ncbi:hypothetical protein NAV33_07510 [Pseudomonas stutzeri]|uniref:hypothetical protein n=1 Tax=Stutzerimonas stutzeri TaxID=316 RepID=UPI00210D60E7|nr:hypothetical protein [Stutzerimonas stutzeri]MCQ4311742.1 hypothetical protein [Stutzerimonas stutzeri]
MSKIVVDRDMLERVYAGWHKSTDVAGPMFELRAVLDAEPTCSECEGYGSRMTTNFDGFPVIEPCPCRNAKVEPAPAQDEQEAEVPRKALADFIEYSVHGPYGCNAKWLSDKHALVAALTRPAQTGQRPVAWVYVKDRHEGPYEFHGLELLDSGKHNLYAAPIAQAEQPSMQQISDYLHRLDAIQRELIEREARLVAPTIQTAPQPEQLPHWEPCNPGCDPEFNGQRSRYCAELCHGARAALSATPSPAKRGDA